MTRIDNGSFFCPSCRQAIAVNVEYGEHIIKTDSANVAETDNVRIAYHWEECFEAKKNYRRQERKFLEKLKSLARTFFATNIQHDGSMSVVQEVRDDRP